MDMEFRFVRKKEKVPAGFMKDWDPDQGKQPQGLLGRWLAG